MNIGASWVGIFNKLFQILIQILSINAKNARINIPSNFKPFQRILSMVTGGIENPPQLVMFKMCFQLIAYKADMASTRLLLLIPIQEVNPVIMNIQWMAMCLENNIWVTIALPLTPDNCIPLLQPLK